MVEGSGRKSVDVTPQSSGVSGLQAAACVGEKKADMCPCMCVSEGGGRGGEVEVLSADGASIKIYCPTRDVS